MFLGFCRSCTPRPFSTPFLTHTHPGKDESSHICTPSLLPPSWFYSTTTTVFFTGSIFILILQLAALPLSFFSLFLSPTPPPSKVLINSQYSWEVLETPTLLSHLPTATLIRATGCTAQSLSRLRSSGSFIHGLYFRCGGQVHGGMNSSSVLLCLLLSCALHSVPPLPPTPKVSATPLTHLK